MTYQRLVLLFLLMCAFPTLLLNMAYVLLAYFLHITVTNMWTYDGHKKINTQPRSPSSMFKNLIQVDSIAMQPIMHYMLSLMLVTLCSS
jgi:hypothetical protein